MNRAFLLGAVLATAVLPVHAEAQGLDLTLFLGRAFPVYDERLTLRPDTPSIDGVDVDVIGSPGLTVDGGPVFGAALAFELGLLGVEGRVDATDVGLDFTGARYDLQGIEPPFQGLTATVTAAPGRFDADRIWLLSLNARLRTPGPVALVVSGGLSYLPDITLTGSVPFSAEVSGLGGLPSVDAALVLRATPEQDEHRTGVNAGAGIRIGDRAALVAEARIFYFREYELQFGLENGAAAGLVNNLVKDAITVRFRPVFLNAQAGLVFRF